MGACLSNNSEKQESAELLHSRRLDKEIREDEKQKQKEAKLLLLGAGDSGKSTILRSMRLVHQIPFTVSERENYRKLIFSQNLLEGMCQTLQHHRRLLQISEIRGEVTKRHPVIVSFELSCFLICV